MRQTQRDRQNGELISHFPFFTKNAKHGYSQKVQCVIRIDMKNIDISTVEDRNNNRSRLGYKTLVNVPLITVPLHFWSASKCLETN
jgi:hypothetical protein